MNPKRAFRLLIAAIVLLGVAGGEAIYFPYAREKAALEEFERLGVAVGFVLDLAYDPPVLLDPDFHLMDDGCIWIARSGPQWMRNRLGHDWMRPFDRVSSADFLNPPISAELKTQIVPLLQQLRSLDELSIDEGVLSDEELLELQERFPTMSIRLYSRERFEFHEWTCPPR